VSQIIAVLIGGLIGAVLSALIGATVIRFTTRWALNFTPPFRAAFAAALFGTLANSALGYAAGFGAASIGMTPGVVAYVVLGLLGWAIYAAFVAKLIKHPDTGPIGYRNGLLVSLVALLFGLFVGAALATMLHLALS